MIKKNQAREDDQVWMLTGCVKADLGPPAQRWEISNIAPKEKEWEEHY